jgi:Pentapeptide repeats (8 copies)
VDLGKERVMADQTHLDILLQGVEAWNEWREQNPSTRPELSGADLTEANLSGVDLSDMNLKWTNLSGADLSRTTNLTQKQIEEAFGDEQTKLPEHLKRPADWSRG